MTLNCWYNKLGYYDTFVYLNTAQVIVVMVTNRLDFVTLVTPRSIPNDVIQPGKRCRHNDIQIGIL